MKCSDICLYLWAVASAPVAAFELYKPPGAESRSVGFPVHRRRVSNLLARDSRRRRRAASYVKADLTNEDVLYFFNVSLGTPEQQISLHIDTGSSDLWVNADSSSLCQSRGEPCASAGTFNANQSSTYQYLNSGFNITYEDGSGATGDYGTDTLMIGDTAVQDFEFAIGYRSSSSEGVCGVGYPLNEAQKSGAGPYRNLPAKLAADGLIASSSYSLWLNDLDASTGQILFGAVDPAQFEGDLVTLPIVKENDNYYEFLISLTDLSLDGQDLAKDQNLPVLLDSGTSLTYLPDSAADAIFSAVSANYQSDQGVATVDCSLADQDVNLTYGFGGAVSINVSMSELVLPFESVTNEDGSAADGRLGSPSNLCIFGIAPAGSTTAVLGDTFLRSAYVVYNMDANEIGLAQTTFNAAGSGDYLEIKAGSDGIPSATGAGQSDETDSAAGTFTIPMMIGSGPMLAFLLAVLMNFGFFT